MITKKLRVPGVRLTPDNVDRLVLLGRAGMEYRSIAAAIPCALSTVFVFLRPSGSRPADNRSALRLSVGDREEIRLGLAANTSLREIAKKIGRNISTVSREVARNGGVSAYRAWRADERALQLTRRPRGRKLTVNERLRAVVQEKLKVLRSLRKHRDRAMIEAMLLGGLRRSEVLGLRLQDLKIGEKRIFVCEGKGGHQRIIPISPRFFITVAAYLDTERPRISVTDRLFVVLKGKNRGMPLSAAGLDEILSGARNRAGLQRVTCHELRHTCFTRLREVELTRLRGQWGVIAFAVSSAATRLRPNAPIPRVSLENLDTVASPNLAEVAALHPLSSGTSSPAAEN